LKYLVKYIVFVVSKKIESLCCGKNGVPLELPQTVTLQLSKLGGLSKLIRRLPRESMVKGMARRHQALSDSVRLRVLYALSMMDLCPCILKQIAGLSDSKLSYHLNVLERAGLVSSRRTKNWMIYSITSLGSRELNRWDGVASPLRMVKRRKQPMDSRVRFYDDNFEDKTARKRKGS
jgi:ArsR family transcriptional regulator